MIFFIHLIFLELLKRCSFHLMNDDIEEGIWPGTPRWGLSLLGHSALEDWPYISLVFMLWAPVHRKYLAIKVMVTTCLHDSTHRIERIRFFSHSWVRSMLDDEVGYPISIVVPYVPPIRKRVSVIAGGTEYLRFGFVRPGVLWVVVAALGKFSSFFF